MEREREVKGDSERVKERKECVIFAYIYFCLTYVYYWECLDSGMRSCVCVFIYVCVCVCVDPYLTPLAGGPLGTALAIAALGDDPLVLTTVPVHQTPAQVVHAVRVPGPSPPATRLRALPKQPD